MFKTLKRYESTAYKFSNHQTLYEDDKIGRTEFYESMFNLLNETIPEKSSEFFLIIGYNAIRLLTYFQVNLELKGSSGKVLRGKRLITIDPHGLKSNPFLVAKF